MARVTFEVRTPSQHLSTTCQASLVMDSPHLQYSMQSQRVRTNSNLSAHSVDNRGGIRKRSSERSRSVSASQADRLQQLVLEQSNEAGFQSIPTTSGIQWITPQHSPQPHSIFPESSIEPFPAWTVPTPPRSDSGVPTVSVDATDDPTTTGISASQDFTFAQSTTSAEMRCER